MTPLPPALGGKASRNELLVWRLETATHAAGWDQGEGAFQVGGRWSPAGRRVIYCALDPSTAILEVAVHKGFKALDTIAHKLLTIGISRASKSQVLDLSTVPDKAWLRPGAVSADQQAFGARLLDQHPIAVLPSVVSTHSWNLLIDAAGAKGMFALAASADFSLDPRLHPA